MPRRRPTWNLVLRLTIVVTTVSALVVLTSGSALWLIERDRPDSTVRSWVDGLWWALSTMTTVGYGDHVPVTTVGRLIGAEVMVVGVAVIGAVAAVVALAMAIHIAQEEERAFEAQAVKLEQRVEARLAGIEAHLAGVEAHLKALLPSSSDPVGDSPEAQ